MPTYKLEKDIILYKNQFEKLTLDIFKSHYLDRVSLELDGLLFRIKYMMKHDKDLEKIPELKEQFTAKAYELRTIFADFLVEFLARIITIPAPFKLDDIKDVMAQDVKIDAVHVKFKMILVSDNKEYLEYVDKQMADGEVFNMFPDEFFRIYTDSYNDGISKAFPELFENRHQDKVGVGADGDVFVHNFTFQTTERCSLNCTYCYQFNKSPMRMDFEIAKKFIDNLLTDQYGYINKHNSPAIIIEFIGGEPLLEIKLTRRIYEYFLDRCYELNHPWFTMHRLSICSNGLQYFDKDVQDFFKDYSQNISFNISIDGNKELHDACRIQPNGEGSYDIDIAALNHYSSHYTPERNSKMTLAPQNMKYLFDSVVDFINQGMTSINLNCVFEEGWNQQTALTEYEQLKKLANYILENDLEHLYIAIFNERQEDMQSKYSDGNFCFKAGTTIHTENGGMFVEELKVGDIVPSASGTLQRVADMTEYFSDDNVVFRATGSFPIHCTSDHKFFAKKFLYMGWKGVIHYSEPGFYPISELKKGDRIALPLIKFSADSGKFFPSLEIAYMLGVYIGDGHINYHNNAVVITPGYDEDKYFEKNLTAAGLHFTTFQAETSMRYTLSRGSSPINERFFKLCESCGSLANNKHLPVQVFYSSEKEVREVLRGYIDTDGYVSKDGRIKANTVSKRLAVDLTNVLRSLGEYPTCYVQKRAGEDKILGRTVTIRDRYEVYWDPNNKNAKNMFKNDDEYGVIWAGIQSIEKDESYMVYCPTLLPIDHGFEEHTLIADGIAATNCGGTGSMLSLRPNGQFYPCIRYMPTSVGNNVKDLCIGTVDSGLIGRGQDSEVLKMMDRITRRSQSNDICYECPLSNDCAWCSALAHTVYGTPNKRPMFICIQMIAEALANVYYWNLLNIKKPQYKLGVRKNMVPDEWALLVINQDELDFLKKIEAYSMVITMENQ